MSISKNFKDDYIDGEVLLNGTIRAERKHSAYDREYVKVYGEEERERLRAKRDNETLKNIVKLVSSAKEGGSIASAEEIIEKIASDAANLDKKSCFFDSPYVFFNEEIKHLTPKEEETLDDIFIHISKMTIPWICKYEDKYPILGPVYRIAKEAYIEEELRELKNIEKILDLATETGVINEEDFRQDDDIPVKKMKSMIKCLAIDEEEMKNDYEKYLSSPEAINKAKAEIKKETEKLRKDTRKQYAKLKRLLNE